MSPSRKKNAPSPDATPKVAPPSFVMWYALPEDESRNWVRQWFGHELNPKAVFNVRGIGIREPMFNENVRRDLGTGDWLIMLFHDAPRLDPGVSEATALPQTLMIWPPGEAQFYSYDKGPELETHSWMHVEGAWVEQQISSLNLPLGAPIQLVEPDAMVKSLADLLAEQQRGNRADGVILQNLFENWARSIRRQRSDDESPSMIPAELLRVQSYLDSDFRRIPPLDELAEIAAMSRSHLCHRFREHFGSSISEYVIRKRMAAAQRMLFDVSLRPGEIAEAVGYPDIYQFSKQFKKTFSVSPSAYRNQQVRRDDG